MEQKYTQPEHLSTYYTDSNKEQAPTLIKYLIILASIILVTIIGIVIYTNLRASRNKTGAEQTLPSPPSVTKITEETNQLSQYSKEVDTQRLEGFYDLMTYLSDHSIFLEKANYNFIVSGKVKEIKDVQSELNNYNFSKAISLTSLDSKSFVYYFTEEELNQVHVYLVTSTNATPVDFSEIKIDDIISLEVKGDLLTINPSFTEIRIIRK